MLAFISCLVYVVGVGGHNWECLTMSSAWTAPGFWLAALGAATLRRADFCNHIKFAEFFSSPAGAVLLAAQCCLRHQATNVTSCKWPWTILLLIRRRRVVFLQTLSQFSARDLAWMRPNRAVRMTVVQAVVLVSQFYQISISVSNVQYRLGL